LKFRVLKRRNLRLNSINGNVLNCKFKLNWFKSNFNLVIKFILIFVAYFTIAERKIIGSIQLRRGPNVVGYLGLLQPLADGAKLFFKETIFPSSSDEFMFAPILSLSLSIVSWVVIPFGFGLFLCDLNLGILYIFVISAGSFNMSKIVLLYCIPFLPIIFYISILAETNRHPFAQFFR
jgi:NADH:ubiquinone oxidoreductase subunit H